MGIYWMAWRILLGCDRFVHYDCVGLVWSLASTDVTGVALGNEYSLLGSGPILILGRKQLDLIWFEFPLTLLRLPTMIFPLRVCGLMYWLIGLPFTIYICIATHYIPVARS